MTFVKRILPFLSVYILLLMPHPACGITLQEGEMNLATLFQRMADYQDDREKGILADTISLRMGELLQLPGSFEYPFDRLNRMGKITSPGRNIRIYTWNVPWTDGTTTCFGYLQYKPENKKINLVKLTDRSADMPEPGESILSPDNWYGMLVYDIVEMKHDNMIYYTLLGYDNQDLFRSCKMTDVLYFNEHSEPVFGKPIFHYQKKYACRILFRYSAKVQMSLKWNEKLKMIVFDHLVPANSSYTGQYHYYGPDLSFDALRFENGIWEWVENVDVRNSRE